MMIVAQGLTMLGTLPFVVAGFICQLAVHGWMVGVWAYDQLWDRK